MTTLPKDVLTDNIANFLSTDQELRETFQCRFTGNFVELPSSLSDSLSDAFPKHKFWIVQMEILMDLPWRRTSLVLVTSNANKEVVAFVWGGLAVVPSKSFAHFVSGQQVTSLKAATDMTSSIANLIAATGPLKASEVVASKKRVEVDLLLQENNSKFRTLRLDFKRNGSLGEFSFLRQDGKRIGAK